MIKRNHIALLIDSSGSMCYLRHDAVRATNDALKSFCGIKDQVNSVVVGTFNSHTVLGQACAPENARLTNYIPSGGTALFDAVLAAINYLKTFPYAKAKGTSYLVMIITDGEENGSSRTAHGELMAAMKELQATDRWTFAFQVPMGYKQKLVDMFGIHPGNISEWEQSTVGAQKMSLANTAGTQSYFTARASGASAVNSFYEPVTTDLSKVSVAQIQRKLDDVAPKFKSFTVDKESVIKDIVEAKIKSPYVIGSAYFLLMKPEKVQPDKAVLIQEKGKKTIWGGGAARDLIGLPQGTHAKVTPGNHSNYDIYVQSRSTNRKVPRGTKVLVDVTLTKALQPTWSETK